MSDRDLLKLVDLETTKAFFIANGAKDECSSCGVSSWLYTGPRGDNEMYVGLPYGYAAPKNSDTMLIESLDVMRPTVLMMCTNCGFHRIHDAFLIGWWASQRQTGKGNPE